MLFSRARRDVAISLAYKVTRGGIGSLGGHPLLGHR
jgi:hypothetical protein